MNYPAVRRERLAHKVKELDLDGLLISNPVNVTYLTGFSGDSSYLLVGRDQILLVSDGRFSQQLHEECPDIPAHIRPPQLRLPGATVDCLKQLNWSKIGIESGHLTVGEYEMYRDKLPAVAWKTCGDAVEQFRQIKDPSEVAAIRDAIAIAERAFERFRASLKGLDTEKKLHDRLEMLLREEGAREGSFPAIVAAGPRSALPHCPPSGRSIGSDELVLIDWGACGGFYMSDLTRVLAINRISAKFSAVYAAVAAAQSRAIAQVRPGIEADAVDAEARRALDEAGFGNFFSHGLGHGLGLEVHEAPAVRPNSPTKLEAGMVITIEPGVYLPDWGGIRIEDDVLVTADGHEVLTSAPKAVEQMVVTL